VKNINTSTFDFPTLRNPRENFVYVDKTAQIYGLAKPGGNRIYFFPRPRRFGKSLLLSTLKALFQGRRELFRGLAIEQTDWDWDREVYPVLHLDMSKAACRNVAELEEKLLVMMEKACSDFGIPFDKSAGSATNFMRILDALPEVARRGKSSVALEHADAGKYVLLIDEYDSPIAGLLDSEESRAQLPAVRKALHDFYIVAKANCSDMRFMMVTGVSKFAKTSIFSAFNNPVDVSLDARTADLVGYTHEELERYFHEHIQTFANRQGLLYEQAFDKLLSWYDSYQFAPSNLVKVVNPVSLGRALSTCELRGWWEATAGSTLIVDALKAANKAPVDFADAFAVATLDSPDALEAPLAALLYQGGYLTIDRPINDRMLLLKIPNQEVRESLEQGYMSRLLGKDFEIDSMMYAAEQTAAQLAAEGVTDSFKTLLQSAYAKLPHDWVCADEKEAKRYFIAFMCFARAEIAGEPQHATGRPDAVIYTEKGIYVFEFKFKSTAAMALKQCRARNYAACFVGDPRPVYYVGVNYSPRPNQRTINDVRCVKAE